MREVGEYQQYVDNVALRLRGFATWLLLLLLLRTNSMS